MPLREDEWLARVLGRPAFVLDGDTDDACDAPGFYWTKVATEDVGRLQRLIRDGFYLVDTNVTFAARGAGPAREPAPFRIEPVLPEQHRAVVDLAVGCFRYSRFHLDPAVSAEEAARIKGEWIRSYLEGERGLELLVASDRGTVLGFLAVLESHDARVIDLIGVGVQAQRRGIGTALVARFRERHGGDGRRLLVGTQIANAPSLRLYASTGFVPDSSRYVLHRHVEPA